jgi:hypothetical protein
MFSYESFFQLQLSISQITEFYICNEHSMPHTTVSELNRDCSFIDVCQKLTRAMLF